MRNITFENDEYYHIFNRGVDKRKIFNNSDDMMRFIFALENFNTVESLGGLAKGSYEKNKKRQPKELVEIVAYCLNPNHYHLVLKQVADKGVEKFMHKVGTGYTKYFNIKNDRSGSLFQSSFKAVYVEPDVQLLYLSVYVNLNDEVHKISQFLSKSSWEEYIGKQKEEQICKKETVLDQFKNKEGYIKYAEKTLELILENKKRNRELEQES